MSERDDVFMVARDAELSGKWELACSLRIEIAATHPHPNELFGREGWTQVTQYRGAGGEWNYPESPFHGDDHGQYKSLDGCAISPHVGKHIDWNDFGRLIAYGTSGDNFAGIVQLKDGRFIAWEAWRDVTGSSFSADAYGGDGEVVFAKTPGPCLEYLSEQSREMLEWA